MTTHSEKIKLGKIKSTETNAKYTIKYGIYFNVPITSMRGPDEIWWCKRIIIGIESSLESRKTYSRLYRALKWWVKTGYHDTTIHIKKSKYTPQTAVNLFTIPFGKYEGKTIPEVIEMGETEYLKWLMKQQIDFINRPENCDSLAANGPNYLLDPIISTIRFFLYPTTQQELFPTSKVEGVDDCVMPFGKYKGIKISEINDTDYCTWLFDKLHAEIELGNQRPSPTYYALKHKINSTRKYVESNQLNLI